MIKQPFLQKIALELKQAYPTDEWKNISIVLPNKRAGIFLKKYISQIIDKPVLLPQIMGMEDFILQVSNLQKADDIYLLSKLFAVYKQFYKEETFDEFLSVGQVFLSDFNEIDRYLINPDDIYKNIIAYKAFDVWNFDKDKLTDIQENYLEFWQNIPQIYHQYKTELLNEKLVYQGLLYRYVCDNPALLKNIPQAQVWFCGFNALTASEEKIIQLLQQDNKAQVFWDADKFYLTDEDQEAGVFIRKHFSKLNTTEEPKWIENSLQEQEKLFYEIECSGNILQTKAFNKFFNQETIPASEDTVIVLADEKLLLPLLSSLPEKISGVNVTMGFPLKDAPLSSFILKYIRLFYHIKSDVESHNFYYKEFFELLKEPFISDFLEKKFNLTVNDVEQIFIKNRIIYFKIADLANLIASEKQINATEFYDLFTFKELTLHQLLEKLKQLIRLKRELLNDELVIDKIELEILFEWNKLLVQLQNTLKSNQYISSVKSLLYVLNQMLLGYKIDFYGEPLSGIQIMGMLETRNLDFENVLMLSVNEGVLPKGKPVQTFIPFEVKKHFDLPTVYEKDAIFAYHFYRLLQFPEIIVLFYNNEKDELGSNQEKSRFIHQILNDLPNFNHHKLIYNAANKTLNDVSKKVKITPEIQEQIITYLTSDKGVSPTALNTFLDCPLDFYFKYILKIKEQDTLEENIEASTMGTIIHNALKELYKDKVGQTLTVNDIQAFEKRAPEIIQQLFKNEFKNENYYRFGQNKIIYELTHKIIYNFLEEEKKQLQSTEIKILGLEENISAPIELNIKGEKISIKLNGQIDRIDEVNEQLRIVDYKTGKDKNDKKYVFQLKIYTLLYFFVNGRLPQNSGLLFLINKEPKFKSILKKKEEINQDFIAAVKEEMEEIIDKMLKAEYFSHNEKATYCILCEK